MNTYQATWTTPAPDPGEYNPTPNIVPRTACEVFAPDMGTAILLVRDAFAALNISMGNIKSLWIRRMA